METSLFQWLIEWVWIPMGVAMLEAYRRLLNFRKDIERLDEQQSQRSRHEEIMTTAVRNIEGGVHGLGERLANIEGRLDGR